ncbi:MAG: MBL fold metallo-hydrolase, partial [Atopobium sp.]|nr:MBL fold metallo-hydrolase [Atopobium sp.]
MANQNEGCSCGGHHHDEEHGHGGCCGHHGEHGHGEHGHGGCCGHHGHGGCHHAKDQIGVFKVGPLETNCYIYVSGNECMIIDAGASGAEIAAQLLNLELKYIVATHGHADHVGGVKALKLAVPGAQYLINEADNELAHRAHNSNEIYDDAPEPDGFLHEGDILSVGT